MRRADVALYASKASGRNQVTLYDAEVAEALDAKAREAWFERSQALSGLRALARAIDAKDPATSEHSERVAQFVGQLAQAAGWPDERVARLREAALVHDVGKLAVPDALLTKPGRLTERERLQMSEHVGALGPDRRQHPQRGAGRLDPRAPRAARRRRLSGRAGASAEISDGAALLALADAWDVMIAGRTYSRTKSVEEAYEECVALAGRAVHDRRRHGAAAAAGRGRLQAAANAGDALPARLDDRGVVAQLVRDGLRPGDGAARGAVSR